MDYLTVKEVGEKRGVTSRMVALYCVAGRIEGTVKRAIYGLNQKMLCPVMEDVKSSISGANYFFGGWNDGGQISTKDITYKSGRTETFRSCPFPVLLMDAGLSF
jgi:hypothetical protein